MKAQVVNALVFDPAYRNQITTALIKRPTVQLLEQAGLPLSSL